MKSLPTNVTLRDERIRHVVREHVRDQYPEERFEDYVMQPDPTMDSIIASANGNPAQALRAWFNHMRGYQKHRGVYLIPGQLQVFLNLPVRQVYIHLPAMDREEEIYRLEKNGNVTTKLL